MFNVKSLRKPGKEVSAAPQHSSDWAAFVCRALSFPCSVNKIWLQPHLLVHLVQTDQGQNTCGLSQQGGTA